MKSSLAAVAACLSAALTPAQAIQLSKRQDGGPPRVMHFNLERAEVSHPVANDRARLARRAGTIAAPLANEQTLYFINASLGTPPQPIRFHIDTGSSDMWVNTPDSSNCRAKGDPCAVSGTYVANDSSTYHYVNSLFNITYEDSSGAAGDYVTDVLLLDGHNITDMEFAIGYESSSDQSLLGIGYEAIEAEVNTNNVKPYQNLPAKLSADGLIASTAYSLWLNDLDASTGSILFGGVDRAKYTGDLHTVDVQKIDGGYLEFLVAMTAVVYNNGASTSKTIVNALLDSGTSLTYLPDDIVQSMYDDISARYISDAGVAVVDCDLGNSNDKIEFQFGNNVSISVGMDELVLTAEDVTQTSNSVGSGRLLRRQDFGEGSNQQTPCVFGISPAGDTPVVLGDTFLRSAYVVYDLSNNQISLAQTSFNATKSDIVEIGTGSGAVPQSSGEGEESDSTESSGVMTMARPGLMTLCTVVAVVFGTGLAGSLL